MVTSSIAANLNAMKKYPQVFGVNVRKEIKSEDFDIEAIQKKMLEVSKDYAHEKDEFEILTELQHFGGYTNLIDFTTDSHIALFFACGRFP